MNSKKLLDRLLVNWRAKSLSLIVALLLFVLHRVNLLQTKSFNVPLITQGAENLIPEEELPEEVRITLTGKKDTINTLNESDFGAYIDLTSINDKGSYRRPIKITRKGSALSLDISGLSVTPVDIPLNLDVKAQKDISVAIVVRGNPPDGYDLVSQSITPMIVSVEGPASELDRIVQVNTAPIDLNGRTENFSLIARLIIGKNFVIKDGNTVEYRAKINRIDFIRDYNDVEPQAINLDTNFDVTIVPNHVDVRMRGTQETLDLLTLPEVIFDCSEITAEGTYSLSVTINDIDGLQIDSIYPEIIQVTFTKKAE